MSSFVGYIQKIYDKIPMFVWREMAFFIRLIPSEYRFGIEYKKQTDFLNKFNLCSDDEKREIVNNMVIAMINHAYYNVPFYHKMMEQKGVCINDIKCTEDLCKLPIINKKIVRENLDDMLAKNISPKLMRKFMTSGTTGEPLLLYQDSSMVMREWACVTYLWKRIGYTNDSSRLVLTGKKFRNEKKGINWQWDVLKQELRLNITEMSDVNMKIYCEVIEKYKPEYIHGYMSAIVYLSKYIEKHPIQHKFKGIIAISETIYDNDRLYVENVLGIRVYSFYGHTERAILAGECEKSRYYHVEPTYGYVEIVDEDDNIILEEGKKGRIIATGFMNKSMPLLRYDTGDIGEWSNVKCECGRNYKLIKKIYGREKEVFVNSEGVIVSYTVLENIHTDIYKNVLRHQFRQAEKGKIKLLLCVNNDFIYDDIKIIKKEIEKRFSGKMELDVKVVEDIPLEKNRKMKVLIQEIDIEHINDLDSVSEEK